MNFSSVNSEIPLVGYTDHPIVISIDGNLDFQIQASGNGWIGDGSETFPYSIDNLNITNSTISYPLLTIENTDVYFNITNSLFDGGLMGIYFNNVTNGIILNSIIRNSAEIGIYVSQSEEILLSNDEISTCDMIGIYFNNVNTSTIYNCSIWENHDQGVICDFTEDVALWNNSIYNNDNEGILLRDGEENTIKENFIYENGFFASASGIVIGNADWNNITNNYIFRNGFHGVHIFASENNRIHHNAIYDNGESKIFWSP